MKPLYGSPRLTGPRTGGRALLAALAIAALASCAIGEQPVADEPAPLPETIGGMLVDARPHPDFAITLGELAALVDDEPEAVRAAVRTRPQVFLDLVARVVRSPDALWVLVDKQNALPSDYEPTDLVALTRYDDQLILNRNDLSLRALIMPHLIAMVEAARLDGVILDISSTYRSYEYQEGLFERWVAELGLEQAERVSARAGTSQHQLGTTVDFGSITPAYAQAPGGRWLARHAWRYGFSLSYPDGYEAVTGYSFEPWHYRYVGRDATRLEREFFGGIQQYMLVFLHEHAGDLGLSNADALVQRGDGD